MAALTYSVDPFAALGLTRDASPRAIKARYYQLARKYHPNTKHILEGPPDRSKSIRHKPRKAEHDDTACEHFHKIYDAYTLLSKETQRRRYIEWAALEELDTAVDSQRVDVQYLDYGDSGSDGWSSDLDDFDIASYHRSKRDRSPVSPDTDSPASGRSPHSSDVEARGRVHSRRKNHALPAVNDKTRGDSDQRAAAERRRKLNRIKRKEVEVFEAYRDAKLVELEAQVHAERLKDIYERTKAKREKMQQIPLETSTRVKMIGNIIKATRLLRPTAAMTPLQSRKLSISTSVMNDDFVSISSPLSARPGASMHRRGFSTDVSGDQTDSDEDTPHPAHRHPFRSPTPNGRPSISREHSPAPSFVPILAPVRLPNRNANMLGITLDHTLHDDQPSRIDDDDSMFRLFVKRPTGFGEHELGEDLTSPITQPFEDNHHRELIHLPLGVPLEQPADKANGTPLLDDSDSDTSPERQVMFQAKIIGNLQFPVRIPKDHVHELDLSEEARLLGKPLDADTDPKDLLKQIRLWDANLASRFIVKPDIVDKFAFRLISHNHGFIRHRHHSFIALSYRRTRTVERHSEYYTLPLASEMLQAVWEERISDNEGLWIDQISINQDDDYERNISMSAMDLVYRGARLIVVVLDDIPFEAHERDVLEKHMEEVDRWKHLSPHRRFRRHSPPWLEAHDDLFQVVHKLLSASWFKRAWCRHEMRLARDHIFLIPVRNHDIFGKTVLRLSSSCLAHLLALATEVPFTTEIELLKPALHAFFRDRTETSGHKEKRSHHGNFTTVAAEVFRMQAGGNPNLPFEKREADARWDRMSIILNSMECGLALRTAPDGSRPSLSNEDCYYSLLMLALAARDPGALCSAGKPLLLHSHSKAPMPSWLFEPTVVDAGLNNYKTLTRLPFGAHLRTGITENNQWVQLDLKFLEDDRADRQVAAHVPDMIKLATDFMEKCEAKAYGRHRRRYLINDEKANKMFGSMRDVYIQTLAGVFCCGPDWMSSICQRYAVGRWKQDLQPAYWLLVNLCSMSGRWPVLKQEDWTPRAAGFIMDFVNFLIIRGMPQRQLRQPETWRPVWVTTRNRGKVLTFSLSRPGISAVVPSVLLDNDYRDLARLWILAPKADGEWTLLGKSVLFGDESAKQIINTEDEMVRKQQKVFGRSVEV